MRSNSCAYPLCYFFFGIIFTFIIENKCQELGYDDQNSIAKYLVQGNPFYEECTAISLWIGAVWVTIRNIQAAVASGTRDMPTIDEVIAELPKYNA